MPDYRRYWVPGGTYFFTVNLADRSRRLLVERVDVLRGAVDAVVRSHPFDEMAWVVLPNHLHALWVLPDGDDDFAMRWMLIKQRFSRQVVGSERISDSRRRRGERGVWQRRYWEHLIRDQRDLRHHIDYIHFNPVKHRLVSQVADWPHSSFHAYLREGRVPVGWGG